MTRSLRSFAAVLAALTGVLASCAPPPRTAPGPVSGAGPKVAPPLPAVPLVDSALAIRIVYPPEGYVLPDRGADSNFIFGTIGSGRATLAIDGQAVKVAPNGAFLAWLPLPPGRAGDTLHYDIVAARGADTARKDHRIRIRAAAAVAAAPVAPAAPAAPLDTSPVFVRLGGAPTPADTDRSIVGRPTPAGTYRWFFLPGTVARLTGRSGGFARVQLDSTLDVWVDSADATLAPDVASLPRRSTSNARVRTGTGYSDVIIRMAERPAYFVEERADALVLTLYGTRANTDQVSYGPNDRLVRAVDWEQVRDDRAQYTIHLRNAPYGYLVMWDQGGLVVRVRETPKIDPARPLAGLTIAVDPGHPPGGATGPTGLWEPQAALWVAQRVERLLKERGANVVMTRTTMDAVGLTDRPVFARRAGAHAFVSVHLNALPDFTNPFLPRGTGTYFYRTHSEPLAREVQRGLVENMGLLNEGVYEANFAVVRSPWMPGVLCEGAYLMFPEQENALRTAEFQERYALGIVEGLERYFASLAR